MSAEDAAGPRPRARLGRAGALESAPPWILGRRGVPREAPENTLASLSLALERGLGGVAYELRACASGEPCLLADATLERTSDLEGPLAERTLPELAGADAGLWFGARFRGERIPTLPEALAIAGASEPVPMQLLLVCETGFERELARELREAGILHRARVAARTRESCLVLRDEGFETLLWLERQDEDLLRFAADARLAGVLAPPRIWRDERSRALCTRERWVEGADEPEELLEALRLRADGLTTSEPARALAARALLSLAGAGLRSWPLAVPELPVEPRAERAGLARGGWSGRWESALALENPFDFELWAEVLLLVRRGAFALAGLPATVALAARERIELPFTLEGGSWRPGGDPLVRARLVWKAGRGRKAGSLVVDASLHRVRGTVADPHARRLALLREAPRQREASLTLRRRGGLLLLAVEDSGGLFGARVVARVEERFFRGGRGLRVPLPADFDERPGGIPFSCGIEGRAGEEQGGALVTRRWAGGLPDPILDGAPGRLVPLARA